MDRSKALAFMAEMMKKFDDDNVPQLMKARNVEECEMLARKYMQDTRFEEVARYAIDEGCIDATSEEFDISEPMNAVMLFYCFECEYEDDQFDELYLISEATFEELVRKMAAAGSEVERELAELMGMDECEDPDDYQYDEDRYHIMELPMGVLINYEDPDDYIPDELKDGDEADEHCSCSESNECHCGGKCGSESCKCKKVE